MKIETYTVGYQWYLIPTMKITPDRFLYGHYSFEIVFLNKGLSFNWGFVK